jgi:hypothetical protein
MTPPVKQQLSDPGGTTAISNPVAALRREELKYAHLITEADVDTYIEAAREFLYELTR